MTPDRFNAIREKLGLTWREYGEALGVGGTGNNGAAANAHRYYRSGAIPPYIARLAVYLGKFGLLPNMEREVER